MPQGSFQLPQLNTCLPSTPSNSSTIYPSLLQNPCSVQAVPTILPFTHQHLQLLLPPSTPSASVYRLPPACLKRLALLQAWNPVLPSRARQASTQLGLSQGQTGYTPTASQTKTYQDYGLCGTVSINKPLSHAFCLFVLFGILIYKHCQPTTSCNSYHQTDATMSLWTTNYSSLN